jgi:hypothetical protein
MQVKVAVYDRCVSMIETEFHRAQHKLWENKHKINTLAKEQRVLKAELGALHELRKSLKLK